MLLLSTCYYGLMVYNISMDLISILNSFENIIIFNIYVWIEAICEYIFIHLNCEGLVWKYPKGLLKE